MIKYLVLLFLNFETIFAVEESYKVYPLILLETSDDGLRRPNFLKVKLGFCFAYEEYHFTVDEVKQRLLFCPATKKEQKNKIKNAHTEAEKSGITTDAVNDRCLFEMKEAWNKFFKLNPDGCEKEAEPFISRVLPDVETKMTPCGPSAKGELYRYGYQIWLEDYLLSKVKNNLDSGLSVSKVVYPYERIIDFEIYGFCYDINAREILYTKHKILSPNLLYQKNLRSETEKKYQMSSNNFDIKELDFQERADKYGKEEKRNENVNTLFPGYKAVEFVPPNDFAFALWRKPTFHYLNLELMKEELVELWNNILGIIRKFAHDHVLPFNVYTGGFNILENHNENQNNEEIEEEFQRISRPPQVWIKIVHQLSETSISTINRGIAIIVNNHMNEDLNVKIISDYCTINYCEDPVEEKYQNVHKYFRCCSVNTSIKELFNLNPKLNIADNADAVLIIDEFIARPQSKNEVETDPKAEI